MKRTKQFRKNDLFDFFFLYFPAYIDEKTKDYYRKKLTYLGFLANEKNLKRIKKIKEDAWEVSSKYPIFAVADGVTLRGKGKEYYPIPSPVLKVAKIFCQEAINFAERNYQNFSLREVKKVFEFTNRKIKEFNKKRGITKERKDFNYWDVDFYHCTAGFALIKDRKLYWGKICDSEISVYDKKGNLKFQSPSGGVFNKSGPWDKEMAQFQQGTPEREAEARRVYRNRLDKRNKPYGWGALTGEKEALDYLNKGVINLAKGDIIFLFTDGFKDYFDLEEFKKALSNWKNLKKTIKNLSKTLSKLNLSKFGRERTLLGIKIRQKFFECF